MFESESSDTASVRSPKAVELRIDAQLENLAVVRTVIGAIGTFEDLDLMRWPICGWRWTRPARG
jgi:serine/threonine-protein kinase RsbW